MAWRGETGGGNPPPHPMEAQTYRVYFPKHVSRLQCPVAGCLGGASIRTSLWIQFVYRHVQYTIVILEEVIRPYPRYLQ